MTLLVLDDVDPRRLVSANRPIHHMARAKVCSYWRALARQAAVEAFGQADEGCSWFRRAHVVVTIRFPDRRRRDVANLYPYVAKPLVDGLIDARVLADDDDLHMTGPDLRRNLFLGPHRVSILIEEEPQP